MKILFSPQVRNTPINYKFSGEVITIDGQAFDFSAMPDGIMTESDSEFIVSAERTAGELSVTLINGISETEDSQEVLYPDWVESITLEESEVLTDEMEN